MTNDTLLKRATVVWLLLLAAGLTLAACGAAAPTEPVEASDPVEAVPATEEATDEVAMATDESEASAVEAEATSEEIEATEEAAMAEPEPAQEPAIVASPPASCVPIDIPDNELIPAPTEDDWAIGPETASITVIEYGDFQ